MTNMVTSLAKDKSEMEAAYADFIARSPEYARTAALDQLRATEYCRLDEQGQVYLDYTGGSLYATTQVEQHLAMLRSGVFGNPHSSNPTSAAMTERVEGTRRGVLSYFNASAEDYILVFTPNTSGALKLIGESFPFAPGSRFLLTFDNHNSVNGIREFARAKGATITYAPLVPPALRLDTDGWKHCWARSIQRAKTCSRIRRNPIFPASNTRSSSWRKRRTRAGACCSTRQPSCPRTGWT